MCLIGKKILVVTQHYWPENFRINDMVEGFLQHGIAVDVLCGLPNYPQGEWFPGYRYTGPRRQQHGGAEVYRAGEVRRKGNTSLRIFLNYVSWPVFALFSLPRLPGGYDAVLCYNTSPVLMNLPAIRYARRHKVPLTSYVLDLWPENLYSVLPVKSAFWQKVALRVSTWHYKKADQLITMSEGLRQRLLQRTGKAPQEVAVVPQYCEDFYAQPPDTAELAALREKFAGRFNLVFTGNFSPAQSLETVLRAACTARAAGAESLHLLLVGDGMSRAALEQLAQELDAGNTVTFYGSVSPRQIPLFTALADALVVSLSDSPDLGLTVPAKVSSYMAAAKPILASMNGEGARALAAADCGFVSAACDEETLAANMLRLYRMDKEQRAVLGRNAFAYYEKEFSRAKLLSRVEAFVLGAAQEE